jgi:hypothetical protein
MHPDADAGGLEARVTCPEPARGAPMAMPSKTLNLSSTAHRLARNSVIELAQPWR